MLVRAGSRRGEEVTVLVARPTTLAGVFDALDQLLSAHMVVGCADYVLPTSLNPIRVRPDDIAMSAEPAATSG
jgi:hypothetical protein